MKALLLALSLISSLTAYSAELPLRLQGTYQKDAMVRFFGTKEFCEESQGEYVADEEACYLRSPGGHSIVIGARHLDIETIYGPANMRSFQGAVVKVNGNEIHARETELGDDGKLRLVKDGCRMKIRISADGKATSLPGKNCDERLSLYDLERVK